MNQQPNPLLKAGLPVLILVLLGGIAFMIASNPPGRDRRGPPSGPQLTVEVMEVTPQDYTVRLESYGTVQPRTQSMLVAQVSGQITSINPAFRDGGFFEAGELLVEIDPRDYEADVRIAEATLAEARQVLAEAEARSAQAREDWTRLGNEGEPSPLVLRQPQLDAARARVQSAQSTLRKASLELERTRIVAPYAGRVLDQLVDVGQVVANNTQLAEIYATDYVEVRLPLRNRDLEFIDLPEQYRFDSSQSDEPPEVALRSDLANDSRWAGRLVRTEGAIDTISRQLHVVAQIDDPFGTISTDMTPIKIGQYVTAIIEGDTLPGALVVPNETIYQGAYMYVVEDGLMQRRNVTVAWQNDVESVIGDGLVAGELVVTTPLGQVTSGTRVNIAGRPALDRTSAGGPAPTPGSNAR
jgi:RND family efflux transporter MFP subunit